MNIEENIKLFQQYQKSNKLEKASEMVDAIADTLKTDGRTVLCANHILEFYLFEYYFKTRDYEAVRYPVHRMYHSLAKKYITNNVSLNLSVNIWRGCILTKHMKNWRRRRSGIVSIWIFTGKRPSA